MFHRRPPRRRIAIGAHIRPRNTPARLVNGALSSLTAQPEKSAAAHRQRRVVDVYNARPLKLQSARSGVLLVPIHDLGVVFPLAAGVA